MRAKMILLAAAMACTAASANDHAIIERGFAGGRDVEVENDLYEGKAAVYRPGRLAVRVTGARGERCETRLAVPTGQMLIDWQGVRRLELGQIGGVYRLYIKGGIASDTLSIQFPDREAATPVLLAMERLQTDCRTAAPPWR